MGPGEFRSKHLNGDVVNNKAISGVYEIEFESENWFVVSLGESHCTKQTSGNVFEDELKGSERHSEIDLVVSETFAEGAVEGVSGVELDPRFGLILSFSKGGDHDFV